MCSSRAVYGCGACIVRGDNLAPSSLQCESYELRSLAKIVPIISVQVDDRFGSLVLQLD